MCGDRLKAAAAVAMHTLWESWLAWKDAEEATIAGIKVLCCTTDVALKGVSKLANYPGNLLFRHNSPRAAITDELQCIPDDSFLGLAEHAQTVVGIGQRVRTVGACRAEGLATLNLDLEEDADDEEPQQSSPSDCGSEADTVYTPRGRGALAWADLLLRGPDRATHIDFWKLTETKCCGHPLVGICPKVALRPRPEI